MKKRICLIALVLLYSVRLMGQAPGWSWAKSAGGNFDDYGIGITKDKNGNIYIGGAFRSAVMHFDSIALTNPAMFNTDLFLAKYDSSGNAVWAKSAAGLGYDEITALTTDDSGYVYVCGNFDGLSLTFDTITFNKTGSGSDFFFAKFDTAGNVLWAKHPTGSDMDIADAIVLDKSGNIFISGFFRSDTLAFDNTSLHDSNTVSYGSDGFIAKFNPAGVEQWAKAICGHRDEEIKDMTVDSTGNVYVTGYNYSDTTYFDTLSLIQLNINSVFIAKFDSSGTIRWAKTSVGLDIDEARGVAVDKAGNSYIAGKFVSDSISFDNYILLNSNTGGFTTCDLFVVKYDSSGNVIWAQSADGGFFNADDDGDKIRLDAQANVYVTGMFSSDTLIFGSLLLKNHNPIDLFLAKLDSAGSMQWLIDIGGNDNERDPNMYVDENGYAWFIGRYSSSPLYLNNLSLPHYYGLYDIVIAKLDSGIIPVGMSTHEPHNAPILYPNPSTSHFTISSPVTIDEIAISDVMGRVICDTKPKDKKAEVTLEREGIYFVRVRMGEESVVKKVVLQR